MTHRILTPTSVATIKRQLMRGECRKSIAKDHGVAKSHIASIAIGRSWASVQVEGFDEWRKQPKRPHEPTAMRIMDLLTDGELSQGAISRICGCSQSVVSDIANGKRWMVLDHPWARAWRGDMGDTA